MKNKFLETGEAGYHPFKKVKTILKGLRYAVLNDFSVLYKVVVSIAVILFSLWFHKWVDAALIIMATGFALSAELFNTAIEAICDFVEARHNHKIGIIKDIVAAAAGVAIFVWLVVIVASFLGVWQRLV